MELHKDEEINTDNNNANTNIVKGVLDDRTLRSTNDKIRNCSKCTFIYAKPDSLILHQIVHNSKRPYQCTDCDYKTTNSVHFNRHILKRNKDKHHF